MAELILNSRERSSLEQVVLHAQDARLINRAYALLWLDEDEAAQEIAGRLQVSRQSVYNWTERFGEREGMPILDRLADGPRSGRPRTAYGIIDSLIETVIESDPRVWGFRSTVWTAPLLVSYLERKHHLEVSRQSIRLAIARIRMRWKRPRYQLALRPETWRQAKGGLNTGFLHENGLCF